jgi:hypothetical protein
MWVQLNKNYKDFKSVLNKYIVRVKGLNTGLVYFALLLARLNVKVIV